MTNFGAPGGFIKVTNREKTNLSCSKIKHTQISLVLLQFSNFVLSCSFLLVNKKYFPQICVFPPRLTPLIKDTSAPKHCP